MPKLTPARYEENFPGSEFSDEEREFLVAVDRYRTNNRRTFLTMSEVLRIFKTLGYSRPPAPTVAPKSEDFR